MGSHGSEGVELSLAEPKLNWSLQIQSTSNTPVNALKVVVTPLRDPTGKLQKVQWDLAGKGSDSPVPVAALGSVIVTVTAELPLAGTYTGDIFLLYGDELQRVPLSVSRAPQPIPVVKQVLPVATTASVFSPSEATVALTVGSTADQDLSVGFQLGPMTRVSRDALQFQAPVTLKAPPRLTLPGGAPTEARIELAGLEGAGEYKGTLYLQSPGAPAVEQELRVFLKEPWGVPLVFIWLGILLSGLLRWVAQHFRPRLELQHGILLLRRELEHETQAWEPLDAQERRVLSGVLNEADRLNTGLVTGGLKPAEASTRQLVLQQKRDLFPVWVEIRRQVREVRPFKLQEAYAPRLTQAETRLLSVHARAEELEQTRKELMQVPEAIAEAVRNELKAVIEKLQDEVKKHRDSPFGSRLDAEVSPLLETALQHVAANETQKAFEPYEQARGAYLQLLVLQLNSQLPKEAPQGFPKEPWESLRDRVLAELDTARSQTASLETAFQAYTRAHRLFLREGARALLDELPNLRKRVDHLLREFKLEERTARKSQVDTLRSKLQDVLRQVQEDKLSDANAAYGEIRRELQEVFSPPRDRAAPLPPQPVQPSLAALAPALSARAPGILEGLVTGPLEFRSVTRLRWSVDLGVSLVVGIGASLLGILSLWANDLTWGGWAARATAFLWGLGLHHATLGTLAGLAEGKVDRKETP
ncbi:hypothetical protein [Hyalangium gracile]|uniref:hypothetical protein n=1 Tax=Hyalangium gracile TaxID=394092 RepID=UPI001CCA0985|nr:hypothetical protein [Hyalangium gracile]